MPGEDPSPVRGENGPACLLGGVHDPRLEMRLLWNLCLGAARLCAQDLICRAVMPSALAPA